MKNIESRLTKIEKAAAMTERVTATYRDNSTIEMDLLQAVRLLLAGTVRIITRPWKPGEMREHQDAVLCELEEYMDEVRDRHEKEKEKEKECTNKNCEIYIKYCTYEYRKEE